MRMPVVGQPKPVLLKNKGANNFYQSLNLKKMQTTKMNLANIQGKLSREDMKKVMAGKDEAVGTCPTFCWNYGTSALGTCTQASFGCTCSVGGMCS